MCTYKVRTLQEEDDLDRLIDGVYQITRDVTGLRETYRRKGGVEGGWGGGRGSQKVTACMKYSKQEMTTTKGFALLIHPKIKDCVTDFETYSNRVMGK